VHNEEEITKILPIARKHGVPVTFRAAGTSLSGQAITDSVLLKLSHTGRNFRNYTIHVSSLSSSLPMCCEGCHACLLDLEQKAANVTVSRDVFSIELSSDRWGLCFQGDGSQITVEPGLIGGEINALLARHKQKHGHPIQYKIGPDPSSIDSCMVGGMVANNSSGMCCGVSQNVSPDADAFSTCCFSPECPIQFALN
jgi:D-lactate dehydrogenase